MKATIQIHANSAIELALLGAALAGLYECTFEAGAGPVAGGDNPGAGQPPDTGVRITDPSNVSVGDHVQWHGARFNFDGVVEQVHADNQDQNSKVVYVRRGDTGKLVSLTRSDLTAHSLTRI